MRLDLRHKVLAGFGACILIISFGGYASYSSIKNLTEINHLVVHTNQVLNSLARCLSLLSDAESGARGYALTGKEEYLEPYHAAQQSLTREFIKLGTLTVDNSRQQQRIDAIAPLMADMMDELVQTIDARRTGGLEASRKRVDLDRGKQSMDRIRKLVAEMEREENALLSARDEAAERQARQSISLALITGIVALAGIAAGTFIMNREIFARQQAERELQVQHQELVEAHTALNHSSTEQLEMKDRILSQVSHELRTPLNAAYQFVTILQDGLAGEMNAEQKDYLAIIFRNLKQLQAMIGDVLDTSRVADGKLSIELQPTDLNQLVNDLVRTLISPASERNIKVIQDVPSDLPMVEGDPVRVRQVITNLLDNAIKFSPENGSIVISAGVWSENSGFVRLSVSDTGRGIPVERLEKIFYRLYQVNHQTDTARKGLGLGLYICRELVTRMGGKIWAESEEGKGSKFSFTLPVQTAGTERLLA